MHSKSLQLYVYFIFQRSFRFTEKFSGNTDFPHTSLLNRHRLPHHQSSTLPHQSGTFFIINRSTLTHHYQTKINSLHYGSLLVLQFCEFWQIYNDMAQWLSNKEFACLAGVVDSIPGSGRSPGEANGNPLQYSCLENSVGRGSCWATFHWITKIWTWLSMHA